MANLDFTPLYRSTIGFDRVPGLMQSAMRMTDADLGYPPYNIERAGDDQYKIVVALAGFREDGIEVVVEKNQLTVRGKLAERDEAEYLHRGIATRSFERRFDLAEHIEVAGATFDNGLLAIELKRELPEKLKPRKIAIAGTTSKTETIEHSSKKAA